MQPDKVTSVREHAAKVLAAARAPQRQIDSLHSRLIVLEEYSEYQDDRLADILTICQGISDLVGDLTNEVAAMQRSRKRPGKR